METRSRKTRRQKRLRLSARTADKFALYENSVQDPASDVRFIVRVFNKERGRKPKTLREDFCGTAKMCAEWVRRHPERYATGLDLHRPTINYGLKHHIAPLGEDASRVKLLLKDVRAGTGATKFDAVAAFNFSYSVFQSRSELLGYFRKVRQNLKPGGAFFLDLYGGPDAQIEVEEATRMEGGFTYVWEQCPLDAVSGHGFRHIHFRFSDGTEMRRAFTYDWRLWTLPELRDLLAEAGFRSSDVYWEGADEDGEGTGIFRKVKRVENEQSWIAYLVGWR